MDYEILRFKEDGQVAVVTLLASPENGNEIAQLSAELWECCQRFGTNAETRVLVVMGEKADTFSTEKAMSDMAKGRVEFVSIAEPIASLERPVLAGIPGNVQGSELELALSCGFRFGAVNTKIGPPK